MENMYYAQWCLSVIGVRVLINFMMISFFLSGLWQAQGGLMNRILQNETEILVCGAWWWHEAWLRWPHDTRRPGQMMTRSWGPCDGREEQRKERERERSQFGEKSVPEFPGLSRVSPPWAPNLTSTTGSCFRSLVEQLTHGSHQHRVTYLLSALSIRLSTGHNVVYKNTRRMPCKWSRKALKRVRMILPESL